MPTKHLLLYVPRPALDAGSPLSGFLEAVRHRDFALVRELDEGMCLTEPEYHLRTTPKVEHLGGCARVRLRAPDCFDEEELSGFLAALGVDFELEVSEAGTGSSAYLVAEERVEDWHERAWRWIPEPELPEVEELDW